MTFAEVMASYRKDAEAQIKYYTDLTAKNGQDYQFYIEEAQDRIGRIDAFDPNELNNLFEKLLAL